MWLHLSTGLAPVRVRIPQQARIPRSSLAGTGLAGLENKALETGHASPSRDAPVLNRQPKVLIAASDRSPTITASV